jgi:hypothetical protein
MGGGTMEVQKQFHYRTLYVDVITKSLFMVRSDNGTVLSGKGEEYIKYLENLGMIGWEVVSTSRVGKKSFLVTLKAQIMM